MGWSYVGVDPSIMGVGPVPAIENLLKATKLTLNDVDLIEVFYMTLVVALNLNVYELTFYEYILRGLRICIYKGGTGD